MDYISEFKPSTNRIIKVQRLLNGLKTGPVCTIAQEEYFDEQIERNGQDWTP